MPIPRFPNDSAVAGLGQYFAATVQRVDLYVNPNASNASDSNIGSQAHPLLTFDGAIRRVNQVHVVNKGAPIVVHLATHPGAGYSWTADLQDISLKAQVVFIGDGAGESGDDGFTELLSAVAQAGTSNTAIESAGLVADAYHGKTIEMTSGNANGFRRTVRNNDGNTIFPVESFAVGPVAGDTFRVVEPAVVVQIRSYTINGATLGFDQPVTIDRVGDARPGNDALVSSMGSRSYIAFVNMRWVSDATGTTCRLDWKSSAVGLFGVELDSSVVLIRIRSSGDCTVMSGMDGFFGFLRAQLCIDLGEATDIRAWGGWGAFFTNGGSSSSTTALGGAFCGVLCSDSPQYFYHANLGIIGGSLIGTSTDAMLGAFQQSYGQIAGTNNVYILVRNSSSGAASHGLGVNGASIINSYNILVEKLSGGGAAVYCYADDSGQGGLPAYLSMDTFTLTGTGSPGHGLVVSGGSTIAYGRATVTGGFGANTQAGVLNPEIGGAVIDQQDFAAFSDGECIPAAATSDGRDGFIRRVA